MISKIITAFGGHPNNIDIRKKLALIVGCSVLLIAIPFSFLAYYFSKSNILNSEAEKLILSAQHQDAEADQYFANSKNKLENLTKLLQLELAKPITRNEIEEFYQKMKLDADGIWRNRKQVFNGSTESGIFLPAKNLDTETQIRHLRIKRVFDTYGMAVSNGRENIWYLSTHRSEVIFDRSYPNFALDQAANNDYTQTPWVVNTSPTYNPDRKFLFTPPLFDPVPKTWMVSAIYPIYLGNKWLGSIGEDMQLRDVLDFMHHGEDLYRDSQHFLLDQDGNFILAGDWQKSLESSSSTKKFNLINSVKLNKLFKQPLKVESQLLSKNLKVNGREYIAIGTSLAAVNWRHYMLVPIDRIMQPTRILFYIIVVIIFIVSISSGVLIAATVNSTVVKRIRRLAYAMKNYEAGDKSHVYPFLSGTDDISAAAKEFDVMMDRIDEHLRDIEITRNLLQDSEQRWRFALEGARDGVWEFDFSTQVSIMSSRMMELIGLDPQLDDNSMSFEVMKNGIHRNSLALTMNALKAIKEKKTKHYSVEQQVRCKDGSYIWLYSKGMVVNANEDGSPLYMIGTSSDITERKTTEDLLRKAHAKYQHLVENIANEYTFYSLDKHGYFTYVSPSITPLMGWNTEEYMRHYTKTLTNHPLNKLSITYTEAGLRGEKQKPYLIEEKCKDGTKLWLELNETPVFDDHGNVTGLEGIAHDVTDRIEAESKLKLAASVFTHAHEGIMITDVFGKMIEVNDTFTEITGYSREEVIGKNPRILQSGRQSREFYKDLWKELLQKGYWAGELWNRHKNGREYAEAITISQVKDDAGNIQSYVALFTDITKMKTHQQQLEHIAHYDVLTNLPNRVLLADRLMQAMLHCQRLNKTVAVAFLDLDGFKTVNDQYGHEIGDELLVKLTHRMKVTLRDSDTLARIGGDEFVAVLTDLEHPNDCEPLLTRLLQATSNPITINNHDLQVSASIGVTLYPQDGVDADQLMRHADQAMYVAKQAGKNRYHLFDIAQDIAVKTQRESIDHIKAALENNEFQLHYQPKVNMKTGATIGVEALIRWQHPERGLLPPAIFLPVIENHPLSIKVGEWVIETALKQISLWQKSGLSLQVSINIGAHQLQEENFVSQLSTILARHPDVNPEHLELEIVETSALEDISHVSGLMHKCRTIGVKFALDDFGTGYSSLTYLKRLPADLLKIDQSFVRDMIEDPDDLAIVKGVISLAEAFHRKVIAEGVETVAHGTLLLGLGCELAQGYGIARPMLGEHVPEWISKWKPDTAWNR